MKYTAASAHISPDGLYRYALVRHWNDDNRAVLRWILLNPSTADGTEDDPTVRRCVAFSRRWGYGGMVILNLFARRATLPLTLVADDRDSRIVNPIDPVGPDNDRVIAYYVDHSGRTVIAGWGASFTGWRRFTEREREIRDRYPQIRHLGLTLGGHPKHPLYLPGDTDPQEWEPQ